MINAKDVRGLTKYTEAQITGIIQRAAKNGKFQITLDPRRVSDTIRDSLQDNGYRVYTTGGRSIVELQKTAKKATDFKTVDELALNIINDNL